MNNLILKVRALVELILSIVLGYNSFTELYPNPIYNLLLLVVGIFVLSDACEIIDKINHIGKYNKNSDKEEE